MLELIQDSGDKMLLNVNSIVCMKAHGQDGGKGTLITTVNNLTMMVKHTLPELQEMIKNL
jgi:hypothetical protein